MESIYKNLGRSQRFASYHGCFNFSTLSFRIILLYHVPSKQLKYSVLQYNPLFFFIIFFITLLTCNESRNTIRFR